MLSPYRIQPNFTNKRSKKISKTTLDKNWPREHDLKRPQSTSNDLVKPDTITESIIKRTFKKKNKILLETGSVHGIIENNDNYLDEILHNKNL